MPTLVLGAVALVLVLWGLRSLAKADPHKTARVVRMAVAAAALILSAVLTLTGKIGFAVPLVYVALALLGWIPGALNPFGRTTKTPGQVSRVRSAFVEMELDHDTGAMRGRILAGHYEGVPLDALDMPSLLRLLPEIDDESRSLLAAYLDRREPAWREHAQGDATAGQGGRTTSSGPMSEEEAYQVLGLEPGASAAQIGRAHRNLMKRLHPDQGGSTYLAARVNEAKDVLLRRHR
jgi:hypothetical protein